MGQYELKPNRRPFVLHSHADPEIQERQDSQLPAAETTLHLSTIREIARDFGVSIRMLRFYEDLGLLRQRQEGTIRRYDAHDKLRLTMILKGKQLGFSLSEIQDMFSSTGDESAAERGMDLLPEQFYISQYQVLIMNFL